MSDHEAEQARSWHMALCNQIFPCRVRWRSKETLRLTGNSLEEFEDYEVAIGLDKRDARVRSATLRCNGKRMLTNT